MKLSKTLGYHEDDKLLILLNGELIKKEIKDVIYAENSPLIRN